MQLSAKTAAADVTAVMRYFWRVSPHGWCQDAATKIFGKEQGERIWSDFCYNRAGDPVGFWLNLSLDNQAAILTAAREYVSYMKRLGA